MSTTIEKLTALYALAQSESQSKTLIRPNKYVWLETGGIFEALRVSDENDFFRVLLGYKEGSGEHFVGSVIGADFNKVNGESNKSRGDDNARGAYSEESCPQGAWRSVTTETEQTFIDLPEGVPSAARQLIPVYVPDQAEGVFDKIRMKIDSAWRHNGMPS